jgi:hypothetical protein
LLEKNKKDNLKASLDIFPGREVGFEDVVLAKWTDGIDMKPLVNAAAVEVVATGELSQLNPIIIC